MKKYELFVRSVELIDQSAFALSGLVNLTLPTSLTLIYYRAFYGCQKVTVINIPT